MIELAIQFFNYKIIYLCIFFQHRTIYHHFERAEDHMAVTIFMLMYRLFIHSRVKTKLQ